LLLLLQLSHTQCQQGLQALTILLLPVEAGVGVNMVAVVVQVAIGLALT
jgi:hypothetical protein